MGNTVARSHIRDADRGVAKATRENTRRNSVPPPLLATTHVNNNQNSLFPYPQYSYPSLPPPVDEVEQETNPLQFQDLEERVEDFGNNQAVQHQNQEDFRFHSRKRSPAAVEAANAVNQQHDDQKEKEISLSDINQIHLTNIISKASSIGSKDNLSQTPPSLNVISSGKNYGNNEDDEDSQLPLINSRRANHLSSATDPMPDRIQFHPTLSGSFRRSSTNTNLTKRRQRHTSADIAFSRRSSDPSRSLQQNSVTTATSTASDANPRSISERTRPSTRLEIQQLNRNESLPAAYQHDRPPPLPISSMQPIDELLRGWDASTRRMYPSVNTALTNITSSPNTDLALRRAAALIDPALTGASLREVQAARTRNPPRVDKPPKARKVVSFNENVHVVTYPYESSGSPYSSTTELPAITRYPEHKMARRKSKSVMRLLSKVAAANYVDGDLIDPTNPQANVANPSHTQFAEQYDACCGLHVSGETEVVYDELSSSKGFEAEVFTGVMTEEGRLLSFDSSKDILNETFVDPKHQGAPTFYYSSSSSRERDPDRSLNKDNVNDDFDYTERQGSDNEGTLSLSDAHPSCDGIDEPEAIGDQLLSPDKEISQDTRLTSFDIAPLWQRLKRVDELDAVTRSRHTTLSRDNTKRLEKLPKSSDQRYAASSSSTVPNAISVSSSSESPPSSSEQPRAIHALSPNRHYIAVSNQFPHLRQPASPDPISATTLPEYSTRSSYHSRQKSNDAQPRMLPRPSGTSSATTKAAKDRRIASEPMDLTPVVIPPPRRVSSSMHYVQTTDPGTSAAHRICPAPWPMPDRRVVSLSRSQGISRSSSAKSDAKKLERDDDDGDDSPEFKSTFTNREFWEERAEQAEQDSSRKQLQFASLQKKNDGKTSSTTSRFKAPDDTDSEETEKNDQSHQEETSDHANNENDSAESLDDSPDRVDEHSESQTQEETTVPDSREIIEGKSEKSSSSADSEEKKLKLPSPDEDVPRRQFQQTLPRPKSKRARKVSTARSEEIIPRHEDSFSNRAVTRRVQSQFGGEARKLSGIRKEFADALYLNESAFSFHNSLFDDNELTATANELVTSGLHPISPSTDGNQSDHDLDPGNLDGNQAYSMAHCSPVRNTAPLASVFYGNSSPSGSMSPSGDSIRDEGGIADYPEYELLKGNGKEDSMFDSEPHTPVLNASATWDPFEETTGNNETEGRDRLGGFTGSSQEEQNSKELPEVLLHDWSGNTPVEPNVEMDSAPSSKHSDSAVFSVGYISKDIRKEFAEATMDLSEQLKTETSVPQATNEDRAEVETLATAKEEAATSSPVTAMTKTGDFAGVVSHFPSKSSPSSISHRSKRSSASNRKREDSEVTGGTQKEASTQTADTWATMERQTSIRNRQRSAGIESDLGRPPLATTNHGTGRQNEEFQINVDRKSFSEAGYRRPPRALRGTSFMEGETRDRMAEPILEHKGMARESTKDRMRRLGLPQRRRRLSNMETSSQNTTREDGSNSRSVVGRLVNGMNLAKRLVSPN